MHFRYVCNHSASLCILTDVITHDWSHTHNFIFPKSLILILYFIDKPRCLASWPYCCLILINKLLLHIVLCLVLVNTFTLSQRERNTRLCVCIYMYLRYIERDMMYIYIYDESIYTIKLKITLLIHERRHMLDREFIYWKRHSTRNKATYHSIVLWYKEVNNLIINFSYLWIYVFIEVILNVELIKETET